MNDHSDHAALMASAESGAGLCTIIGIEGGFSRRVGAQLAVLPDGEVVGSLADGCLEQQLASEIRMLEQPRVNRYGRGSPVIDFRLPCGGGLDILLDPKPDRQVCRRVAHDLAARRPAALELPDNPLLKSRKYIPEMALDLIGSGPEAECLARVARAAEIPVRLVSKDDLSLGVRPGYPVPDRWTATVLLFHDHEWEDPILQHALSGEGFYIGAQGGHAARVARIERLQQLGLSAVDIDRVRAPIGLIPSCREPDVLAISILAELLAEYEKLREA